MADLAAADVTVTISRRAIGNGGIRKVYGSVVYGDGAKTYGASNGIPLARAKLGLPAKVLSLIFDHTTNGNIHRYNKTSERIQIFEGDYPNAGEGPLLEQDSGDAPAATTLTYVAEGW